ncbi:FlgD immunoglobulin-like domain containing protein [Streptomyces sp. NPDC028635]|uniref:FlgD immunoglobulin-like domain containing protein n=1 Tax=Streptomyces sp. NPDC028635 TaxID=3154800 RepID=UPI003403E7FA
MRFIDSRRVHRTAAALVTAAAVVALTPMGAGTATADGASTELVLPAELSVAPDAGKLPIIGLTGFVQGSSDGGYSWYSFADGSRTRIPLSYPRGTGTDVIVSFDTQYTALLWDPATRAVRKIKVPPGQQLRTTLGQSLVTYEEKKPWIWHLLTPDQGNLTDRVLELPEGAEPRTLFSSSENPYGLFLSYSIDGVPKHVWVDRAFTARPADFATPTTGVTSVRRDRYLFRFAAPGRLRIWDLLGDLSAPLHDVEWAGGTPVTLFGDRVLVRVPGEGGDRLVIRPLAGGAPQQDVLDRITGDTEVGSDGRVIAARSGPGGERTVHSVQAGHDGELVVSKVADIPLAPTRHWQMMAANGVLLTNETLPYTTSRTRERELTVSGATAAGPKRELDPEGVCPTKVECSWQDQTGDGRTVFGGADGETYVVEAGQSLPGTPVPELPSGYTPSRRASGRYIASYAYNHEMQVADLDTQQVVLRRPDSGNQAMALVGGTLWHENGAPGAVDVVDVGSGTVKRTLKVSDCDLTDLQVWGSFVYWECNYEKKSGVRDLTTGTDIPVPEHDALAAQLGDGYLTHSKNGVLSLTPLRGTGATRVLGSTSRYTGAWAVDRFGGRVYYPDEQERLHVVSTGIPASALSVLDSSLPETLDRVAASSASWTGKWWLNKPAASWTVTVRNQAGTAVRTLHGGEARGVVKAVWDGKDESGADLADGGYRWELDAAPADGVGGDLRRSGQVFLTHGGLGTYEPVAPTRLLDTRSGLGAPKTKVGPHGTVTLQVAGRGGVAPAGVSAVVLNVTATNASSGTYVSAYPYGDQRPTSSNLNVAAGRTVPNLVTVPVRDGKVTLYNHAGTVDLIADVAGYYTLSGGGDRFRPVEPARVLDTRSGLGAPKAKVGAGRTVTVQVAGRGGVPATGVSAVVMNVTATNPTAASFVSAYPYGTRRSSASNLNLTAGQTVANAVIVPVKDGKVTLYNHAGTVDLLSDVSGYFTAAASQGSRFRPLAPTRVMDTRQGLGGRQLRPGQSVALQLAGNGGVPAGASAVVLNVTATGATAPTYVAATTRSGTPTVSHINLLPGRTVANLVVVPVVDGKVFLYNHAGSTEVIVDVFGYYTG